MMTLALIEEMGQVKRVQVLSVKGNTALIIVEGEKGTWEWPANLLRHVVTE